jgi:hypothetical protein
MDTDNDGVTDDIDPLPTDPGVTQEFLVEWINDVSNEVRSLPLTEFTGFGSSIKRVRRSVLAGLISVSSFFVDIGEGDVAVFFLQAALRRVDGESPPSDWVVDGPAREDLEAELETLIFLAENP